MYISPNFFGFLTTLAFFSVLMLVIIHIRDYQCSSKADMMEAHDYTYRAFSTHCMIQQKENGKWIAVPQ